MVWGCLIDVIDGSINHELSLNQLKNCCVTLLGTFLFTKTFMINI